MSLLLSTLQATVDDIVKLKEAGGRVEEGSDTLVALCTQIEDVFSNNLKSGTSFLQEDRGYWGYFSDCLEASSSTIRAVQSLPQNKTFLGKGRAFIRHDLKRKTLAEHVQVACRNEKVTAQFYHSDAILRDAQLSTQLVDILYHLNDVRFDLANKMSLDEGWPAFAIKAFPSGQMKQTRLNCESDTQSLISTLSSNAEKSVEQLRAKAQQLRLDNKLLKKQRDVAIEDKNEADIAWNDLVSKLKLQAYNATEECEEAKQKLAPAQREVKELQAHMKELGKELEQAQAALSSLQVDSGSTANKGIDPMQQAKEIRTRFDAQLAVANSEKEEARRETEALREDLNHLKGEMAAKTQDSEKVIKGHLETIAQYKAQERGWEAKKERTVQELRSSHEQILEKLTKQVESLQAQHDDDRRAIAELSTSLQDTERNRESTIKHLAQLEDSLVKERARTEASVSESNVLRSALSKSTEEKQLLWHRIQNLSELARVAQTTAVAKWRPDTGVRLCTGCNKEFTMTNRKHHCRKCGDIYCNDCTSKTALLSGSSKPERICDRCDSLIASLKRENFEVDNTSTYTLSPTRPNPDGTAANGGPRPQ